MDALTRHPESLIYSRIRFPPMRLAKGRGYCYAIVMTLFREQDVRPLRPGLPPKLLVAHAWADYVPNTFIEPHSHLKKRCDFESINLVSRLWDNGNAPDPHTFYLQKGPARGLVKPSDLFRIYSRLTNSQRWSRFRELCRNSLSGRGVHLLHSHFGTTACEIHHVARELGVPHIVTYYGYDGSAALKHAATVAKYRGMFKSAQRFVVLCEEVRERLIRFGCPAEKILVWNMPAGIEAFPYQQRALGPVFRVAMAARFAEAKGHRYFLEALAILAREGLRVHATLLGYGNLLPDIQARIAALNIEKHVAVIDTALKGDFSAQYRELLSRCDAYALPSITDRYGTDEAGPALTMVCAQASGLAGVITPFPGASHSFENEETGFYCAESDPVSLANGLRRLALQPALRERMGLRASEMAHKAFAEKQQVRKLIELYYDVLNVRMQPDVTSPPPPRPELSEDEVLS